MSDGAHSYVADNRFEQYFNPARTLAKMFSVWDGSRGLGGPREDVWLGTTVPVALIRGLGFAPANAERLFHALCLVTFGLGVVALIRMFRPRIGPEHVVAGLLAMFGPFSASFLLPSNLFAMTALSPWLAVVFIRGVREDRPWRWAAVFALLVLWAGNSDTPGLVYVVVMLIAVSVHLVIVERSVRWRDIVLWSTKAMLLCIGCSAWLLLKTYYASEALSARLAATELPSASATSSSWSESLRGLGNWLSYFRGQGQLSKPQTAAYLEQPWIIVATFVPPIVALVVLWKSRWPTRLMFGAMALGGVVVMVGGFGVPNASPLGAATLWLFDNVTVLTSFRNTYKAGGGLVVGVSALAAIGFVDGVRWCAGRSRTLSIAATTVSCIVMVGVAAPFVTSSVYNPSEQVVSLPNYWTEALKYLDGLDAEGRSLIVPAISQADYTWGYVGDDIFDALLARPHATATGWMLSTRTGHNALEAVTLAAQSPHYRQGVAAAMAKRLGITEIVIRNDLNWAELTLPRPAAYLELRSDPSLEFVRSFGAAGQGIVDSGEISSTADYERTLPPVEVYRLRTPGDYLDIVDATHGGELVVAGAAESWPQLFRAGVAGSATDILASGAMSDSALGRALRDGAVVNITDTARRRVRTLLHHEPQLSPTLADGEELDRGVRPVYPDQPHAESVAWFRDATSITGAYTRFGGNRNDQRASLAFDRDLNTSWTIPWSGVGPRPEVKVTLREPTKVRRIGVQSMMTATGVPTVKAVEIRFSDGSTTPLALDETGGAVVEIDGRTTSTVSIALAGLGVFGGEVGLTEVSIDNLDLVERIQTPRDLFTRDDPEVRQGLQTASISYTFSRSTRPVTAVLPGTSSTAFDEELSIRRRFPVVHDDSFVMSGSMRLLTSTSDSILAALLGEPSASSSRPPGLRVEAPAALVLDGDATTSWVGGAVVGSTLSLQVAEQTIHSISITEPTDIGTARVSRVEVLVGDQQISAIFAAEQCTNETTFVCTRTAVVRLTPPVQSDQLTLRIAAIEDSRSYNPFLVRISEVSVNDSQINTYSPDRKLSRECHDLGLRIGPDGAKGATIPVRVSGTIGDVLSGRPISFEACNPLPITTGSWQLETLSGGMFDQIALVPSNSNAVLPAITPAAATPAPAITWFQASSERIDVHVEAAGDVTLTLRTSFDPQWVLDVGGRRLDAQERDAGNSWTFNASGVNRVTLVYEPGERLRVALTVSAVSVLCCLVMVFRRRSMTTTPAAPPAKAPATADPAARSRLRDVVTIIIATALSVALAGPWGLAIGAVVLTVVLLTPVLRDTIGLVPPVLLATAALSSAFTDTGVPLNIDYASRRLAPSTLAAFAVVFLFQSIALAAADERSTSARYTASRASDLGTWHVRARLQSSRLWGTLTGRRFVTILPILLAAGAAVAVTPSVLDRSAIPTTLVSNLRLATSYSLVANHGPAATSVQPLPAVLVAFAPVGLTWLAAFAAGACVVLAGLLAMRWFSRRSAVLAGGTGAIVMAVLVTMSAHSLPSLLATAFATAAVLLAARRTGTLCSAVFTGVLVAGAVLCRPGAVLVVPLVVYAWHHSSLLMRWRVAALLVASLLASSWATYLSDNGSSIMFGWWHNPLEWAGGIVAALIGYFVGAVSGPAEVRLRPRVERP